MIAWQPQRVFKPVCVNLGEILFTLGVSRKFAAHLKI